MQVMKGALGGLMQQAQKMQESMKQAQEELGRLRVTGESGGGLVKVTMTGRHEVVKVELDRQMLADDPEMTEDLIAAAFNDAINRVAELSQEQMAQVTGGLKLPPGMKLPF
jgi:DNA-binding YbaB/EbfC family protein